ncbi:hypothetical protein ScPMuIL_006030 [Solemya velum]
METNETFHISVLSVKLNISNFTEERCVNSCLYLKGCVSEDLCRQHVLDHVFPTPIEWVFICVYAVIFIVGLGGNALVCYVVWTSHHMRTFVNIFIVNLAIADFLVILVCLPPTVLADATETWYLGTTMCKVVPFLQTLSVSVSVTTLSAISVERYFVICHPLKLRLTPSTITICIVGIWFSGILISLPELLYQSLNRTLDKNITEYLLYCKMSMTDVEIKGYQIFLLTALYFIPMCLMAFTYSNISHRLWKNNIPGTDVAGLRRGSGSARSATVLAGTENRIFSRRRAAKMLMTIVIIFALCYLPVHLLNIIRHTDVLHTVNPKIVSVIALFSHGLCYFNSAINPVIYNFMSAKFQKEFKAALLCCRRPLRKRVKLPTTFYSSSRKRSSLNRTEQFTLNSLSTRQAWLNNPPILPKTQQLDDLLA